MPLLCLAALLALPALADSPQGAVSKIGRMPPADGDPAKSAALNVLRYMAAHIGPARSAREPHEWTGEQVLADGSVNGCVEAAKAFKVLYDGAGPGRAVFVGGTRKEQDGGHAVIEIRTAEGPIIIDAAMFRQVTHAVRAEEIGTEGKTLQTGAEDLHITRSADGYTLGRWQYGHVFRPDRKLGRDLRFRDLGALNDWLSENAPSVRAFSELFERGIAKRESNGTFIGPQGETEFIYLKTEDEPFSGTDAERARSGRRALEDKVKYGR